jgi:peptidyl-Lys metalloendopeptidase
MQVKHDILRAGNPGFSTNKTSDNLKRIHDLREWNRSRQPMEGQPLMSATPVPGKKEGGGTPIRFTLTAEPGYVTGKPIRITFTLENLTGEDLFVLTWYTPLEGLSGKIFEVICDGRMIPYEGMMVKRGNPGTQDYMHIAPHGSVKVVVDLAEVYSIPSCRECRVTFRGRIHDIVRDGNLLPRKSGDHQWIDIPGNPVRFRVTEA